MRNLSIALSYILLLLFLPGCIGLQQTNSGNLGLIHSNNLGALFVLKAEAEVVEVNLVGNGKAKAPISMITVNFQDPSIQGCIESHSYHRFIAIESDDSHPIPLGTIIHISIPDLGYMKAVECHYDCSTPKYLWEELPSNFTPNMEIKIKVEGMDLTNADIKGGGLLVIINADIQTEEDKGDQFIMKNVKYD